MRSFPRLLAAAALAFGFKAALAQIPASTNNVAITEINYNPHDATTAEATALGTTPALVDPDVFEFFEIRNLSATVVSLLNCSVTGGIDTIVFGAITLAANESAVVVRDTNGFIARYGSARRRLPVPGQADSSYNGRLGNGGDTLVFKTATGQVIQHIVYNDGGGWPTRADGYGSSLELISPLLNPQDSESWRSSREFGGSPCAVGSGPVTSVVINEILAHSDAPYTDFIELHNPTAAAINIGGWVINDNLSGNPLRKRFAIPSGTTIAAGGYRVFTTADFTNYAPANPLAFSEYGESIFLLQCAVGAATVPTFWADDVNYQASDTNVSMGRTVNSAGDKDFVLLESITLGAGSGAANSLPLIPPVVITEIMYNPSSNELEFVELHNRTASTVNLWDPLAPSPPAVPTSTNRVWELADGISFKFNPGDTIAAGEYILVTQTNPAVFRARYNLPNHVRIFGPYSGALSNGGETLRIRRPGAFDTTLMINPTVRVEKVAFDDGAPWPLVADGLGPSLERLNRATYANDPANWVSRNSLGSPGGPSQIDADADGVPDNWEYAVFQTVAFNDFLTADRDSDGQKDADEFLAGTNPLVANPPFRISMDMGPGGPRLNYATILAGFSPGYYGRSRSYTVLRSPGLVVPDWQPSPGLDSVPATGSPVQHDLNTADPQYNYRVRINLP